MQLLVLGLDYRQADVALRERLAEGVILATCNRTELYLLSDAVAAGQVAGLGFLAALADLPPAELEPLVVVYRQDEAVRHLCRVAAGLESMVLGEHEILGQVRAALDAA